VNDGFGLFPNQHGKKFQNNKKTTKQQKFQN